MFTVSVPTFDEDEISLNFEPGRVTFLRDCPDPMPPVAT